LRAALYRASGFVQCRRKLPAEERC